ncbi:hypothetical protein P692DRAFT_20843696 [Suillus brevipes Sb2]|nr:hypothetical protein P692DRAFT_20843696 [Suillus brevipes Sb2]
MENSSFAGHPVAREEQGTCLPALNMLSFRKTLAGSLPSCSGSTQSHMERYVVNHAFLLAYNVSTTFFTYTLCRQRRSML